MAVELILLENVDSLGNIGEKVRVADGYARNFLLPRNLASPVTKEALDRIEARKRQLQKEYENQLAAARDLAKKIGSMSVTIPMEANEQDKLYGSVGPQRIADALAQEGVEIKRDCVILEEPIHELGIYSVDIKLRPEVETKLKVWVFKA